MGTQNNLQQQQQQQTQAAAAAADNKMATYKHTKILTNEQTSTWTTKIFASEQASNNQQLTKQKASKQASKQADMTLTRTNWIPEASLWSQTTSDKQTETNFGKQCGWQTSQKHEATHWKSEKVCFKK